MIIDKSIFSSYQNLSTMKRINSASDDPAGLAISQTLTSQSNGYDTAIDNSLSMKDLANTADGALASIGDSLQRMRELAVQASNGTLTPQDKKVIQYEIEGLKSSIRDTTKYTEFNTQKILDGTFKDKNIASNPTGVGAKMTIQNSSLETLGIDKFDVTKDFNIDTIDNAIAKVTESRGDIGATSNTIDSTASANSVASENLQAANSTLSDTDLVSGLNQLNIQKLLQQYQFFAQQQTITQKANSLSFLV